MYRENELSINYWEVVMSCFVCGNENVSEKMNGKDICRACGDDWDCNKFHFGNFTMTYDFCAQSWKLWGHGTDLGYVELMAGIEEAQLLDSLERDEWLRYSFVKV